MGQLTELKIIPVQSTFYQNGVINQGERYLIFLRWEQFEFYLSNILVLSVLFHNPGPIQMTKNF